MRFANIRHIAQRLAIEVQGIDDSFLEAINNALFQYFNANKFLQIDDYKYSFGELDFIINQLVNNKYRVFHEWVEQDTPLSNYLISNGKIVLEFSTPLDLLKQHQLFDEYQKFLSPFLSPILKEQISCLIKDKDFVKLRNNLNFCLLLPEPKRIEIQEPLNKFVNFQLKQLTVDDGQFINLFDLIFSLPYVLVLNQLDDSFYSALITYIDSAKLLVAQKKLNALQLNRIKSALLKIKLTVKHKEQVIVFCQSDSFKFKNSFSHALLRWIKSPLFLIVLIITLILFLFYNWEGNRDKKQQKGMNKNISGIDSLTDSELNQVDSLFGFKTDSIRKEGDELQYSSPPQFITTKNLNLIKNTKAEMLYSDFIKDYQIQKKKGYFGNCKTTQKSLFKTPLYSNVKDFTLLPSTNHEIINKSRMELYILVFEPEKEGAVYGALIASGKSIEINLKIGEGIIFYSGQQMNHFNTMRRENNGYGNIDDAKEVSKGFNYHFCSQDDFNYQQTNRIYEVVDIKGNTVFEELSNGGLNVKSKAIKLK